MTSTKHSLKTSHRRTVRRIARHDLRDRMTEIPQTCACKQVKK